jgi:hypothetical protein
MQKQRRLALTSHPLASTPSQLPRPELQDLMAHLPLLQTALAPLNEQTFWQTPQFLMSALVFTSHPSDNLLLQSARFALQALTLHTPLMHVTLLTVECDTVQRLPHRPQLSRLVSVRTCMCQ